MNDVSTTPPGPLLYHRPSCKYIRLFLTTGHAANTAGLPLYTVQAASNYQALPYHTLNTVEAASISLVNVYVDLVVFTHIAGTS